MEDISFSAPPPELDDELNDETFGQMDGLDSDEGDMGEREVKGKGEKIFH